MTTNGTPHPSPQPGATPDIDAELRRIFAWCNAEFTVGRFDNVNTELAGLNVDVVPADVLVGWLSATVCAREQLGAPRARFVERARWPLEKSIGRERAARIFSRLS